MSQPKYREKAKVSRKIYDAENRARNAISMPVGAKVCCGCTVEKDFTEFHRLMSAVDGRQTRCKACTIEHSKNHADGNRKRSRDWYAANKERRLAKGKQWYENNKEYRLEKVREYRRANPDKYKAAIRAWTDRNKDYVRARFKIWQMANKDKGASAQRRYRLRHPEDPKVRALANKLWRTLNKAKARECDANKRARRRGADGSHTKEEVAVVFKAQRGKCANPICRVSLKKGYHEDHITPLILGGSNFIRNIQLLCQQCNLKKHAKDPIVWAQGNGLLL